MTTKELIGEQLLPQAGRERIVVAMDGGTGSRAALRWVAHHLGGAAAQVVVVCVADEEADVDADEADLRAAVLVLRAVSGDVHAGAQLRRGDPVDELVAATAEVDADLLVVGTHATTGHPQSARTTVPGRLAARAGCVVIVVPEEWAPGSGPVVVGSSIDSASETAVDFACTIAVRERRDLIIAHVWELPTVGELEPTPGGGESIPERQQASLDRIVSEFAPRAPGVLVRGDLQRGPAARGLISVASGAALLVVGRRRRSAAARLLLGSTSSAVVAGPPCVVAVVPGPRSGLRVLPDVRHEDL